MRGVSIGCAVLTRANPIPWMAALIVLLQADSTALAQQASSELRPPSAFSFQDARERSVALFREAGKVIQHPRCINCHPAGDRPLQGEDRHLHFPAAVRGPEDMGVPGGYCTAC